MAIMFVCLTLVPYLNRVRFATCMDSSDRPIVSRNCSSTKQQLMLLRKKHLQPLADSYIPKTPAQFTTKGAPIPVDVARTMLHPWTLKMFLEGPMADTDRSSCLVKLASIGLGLTVFQLNWLTV
jgi:hypothetical protein